MNSLRLRALIVGLAAACAIGVPALRGQPAAGQLASGLAKEDSLGRLADEVAREVEQLRGWTFKRRVDKMHTSLPEARSDLERSIRRELPPDRLAMKQAFLRTAGLIPSDCDLVAAQLDVLEQQVAGYYDTDSHVLHLVDRPGTTPAFVDRMILSHELTHALDDQYLDITSLTHRVPQTEDSAFVVTALVEGSATALMLQDMTVAQKSGRLDLADLGPYLQQELARARKLEQLPRYFSAMFGSYIVGAAFLAKGDLSTVFSMPDDRPIGENLLAAAKAPPRSGEQVLHPEKYWNAQRPDEPILIDDRAIERWLAHDGRWIVHRDTLGEMLTAVFTEPHEAPKDMAKFQSAAAWTNPGAIGWGGDRFYLLASGATQEEAAHRLADLQGVWITVWDSAKEREEFLRAIEKGTPPPRSQTAAVGRTMAVVFIGFEDGERQVLLSRLRELPLPVIGSR
ncbi:MAG TPA: hypothetical protein VGK32_03045 [Vicinamibacterales bacterium]|jgi:hypothetical protein